MNALPVAPNGVATAEARERYFSDLERWGFDIAYNAYYAATYEQVVEDMKPAYVEFAAEAHRRGYPAFIQIQVTVNAGDRVGVEESQFDVDNNPDTREDGTFFASFSSRAWIDYLKELTTIFIERYGYDSVVFEEPMYRVDIPGAKDRFYEQFMAAHPGVAYPKRREETAPYLMVQEAKSDALLSFCRELCQHAKALGAKKAGVMPWFFIPTTENTPPGTLNPSCNINRIAQIPELDIIVVRMQPDNVYCDVMRTGDDLQTSARLAYTEIMAHALGKDVIAVNNPSDEHKQTPEPLVPFDFFRDYTVAAAAASPGGFTRHWYGKNYGEENAHMDVLSDAARLCGRLGQPVSPVAFVFAYSGTRHAEPYTYETVFPFYWELARRLQFDAQVPMLTFFADTLEEDLKRHPEVQLLILEEHFPATPDQMMAISRWWQSESRRGLVAFGSGLGYCADNSRPGIRPSCATCPGVFELIGLKQEEDMPQFISDQPIALRDVSRIRRSAFLGDSVQLSVNTIANVRRVFGSRATILYEADLPDMHLPVIAEWRDRATVALFCGFGLSRDTLDQAEMAIKYALREVDFSGFMLSSGTEGIVWSANEHDYVAISNLSDKEGSIVGKPGRANFWDCRESTMLPDGDVEIKLAPHSFRMFRVVGRRSKFYDIPGVVYLRNVIDGAGRADIDIWAGKKTTLVLRASPREIQVDGKHSTVTQEVINGAYHVTLQQCPPGERRISLKW